MKTLSLAVVAVAAVALSASAQAAVTMSTGAGSAVSQIDASADFESQAALTAEPYVENGISVSRTNLSYNNNGCGYAGCGFHIAFSGFSGNYMYGFGEGGYFDISSANSPFAGLEFAVATGFGENPQNVTWSAFLGAMLVGSGSTNLTRGTVVGFSGAAFDRLRYTNYSMSPGRGTFAAPAFDAVRAQFARGVGVVPEPSTWALLFIGFGALGHTMRAARRSKVSLAFS